MSFLTALCGTWQGQGAQFTRVSPISDISYRRSLQASRCRFLPPCAALGKDRMLSLREWVPFLKTVCLHNCPVRHLARTGCSVCESEARLCHRPFSRMYDPASLKVAEKRHLGPLGNCTSPLTNPPLSLKGGLRNNSSSLAYRPCASFRNFHLSSAQRKPPSI